jgi:hypothetical protein
MPPSELFKRSPKKEPHQGPHNGSSSPSREDESLLSPEMQKKRYDTALEVVALLQKQCTVSKGSAHAGPILSIAAHLAGMVVCSIIFQYH